MHLCSVLLKNTPLSYKKRLYIELSTIKYLSNMVFKDYIDSLPNVRLDTINKIAEVTCSSKVTVYRWMAGDVEPPMIKKKIIAEYLGKSVEELFPTTNKQ